MSALFLSPFPAPSPTGPIRVMLCDPDSGFRGRLRAAVDADPLFTLLAAAPTWAECELYIEDLAPELLIIRSEVLPAPWRQRRREENHFPVIVGVLGPGKREGDQSIANCISMPADDRVIEASLARAVRDIYNYKADELLYLVDKYVAASSGTNSSRSLITAEQDGQMVHLCADGIRSIVATGRCVSIQTVDGKATLRIPFHVVTAGLNPDLFLRVHRSIVVNRNFIDYVAPSKGRASHVTLTDGSRLPVGRKYRAALGQAFKVVQR
jgi:DNA-binding LytR/AlgR family response regulator